MGSVSDPTTSRAAEYERLGVTPTQDDGERLLESHPWDESSRPHRRPSAIEGVDAALVHHIGNPEDFTGLQRAVDLLSDTLLSHLAYEEQELVEPLARLGFYANQL